MLGNETAIPTMPSSAQPAAGPAVAGQAPKEPKSSPRDPQGRFPPGQSGNPAGRPKGSRNRVNQMVEKWADKHLEALLIALPQLAIGDPGLMKFLLGRMTPKEWRPASDFAFGDVSDHFAIEGALKRAFAACDAGEIDQETLKGVIEVLMMVKGLKADQSSERASEGAPYA